MKRILLQLLFITLLAALAGSGTTFAATLKMKHVGTIYTDAAGVALSHPEGVSISGNSLWVADSGGKRILSFSDQGGQFTPDKVFSLPDMFPLMVQQAANGDLYVLDERSREIYILGPAGKIKGKFSPKGMPDSKRIVPRSIKLTRDNGLLLLDIFSERVLLFDSGGSLVRQVPFPEGYGACADVAIDQSGNLFLLDSVRAVVYIARGTATTFIPLTAAMKDSMNFPTSLDIDGQGRIYLVDTNGSGLAIINPDGSFSGRRLSMGWSDSHLYYPSQVSINDSGDLFIADTENHRVQHFSVSE